MSTLHGRKAGNAILWREVRHRMQNDMARVGLDQMEDLDRPHVAATFEERGAAHYEKTRRDPSRLKP